MNYVIEIIYRCRVDFYIDNDDGTKLDRVLEYALKTAPEHVYVDNRCLYSMGGYIVVESADRGAVDAQVRRTLAYGRKFRGWRILE